MSANPEAVNFGTGPSLKLSHKDKFFKVLNPYEDTFTRKKTIVAVVAEFVCTLLFVFYASATVVGANYIDRNQNLIPAFGQGFALALAIYVAAPASGGHLNPAVTIAVLCVGRINLLRAILYIIAQFVGAIVGAGLVRAFVRSEFQGNLGATVLNPDISIGGAFGFEFIMTFFLVFVMFGTAIDPRGVGRLAPLAIGLVVLIDELVGAQWTGASMNPARTLGPALISGSFDHYWLYFAAPVCGAIAAAVAYVLYLKIDPVNEAVDQNNNIIRERRAVHNQEAAPRKYQPSLRHSWRRSRSISRSRSVSRSNSPRTSAEHDRKTTPKPEEESKQVEKVETVPSVPPS